MHLTTRNVNTAFRELVSLFVGKRRTGRVIYAEDGTGPAHDIMYQPVRRSSRNGDVLVIDEPVTITYSHPRERVLFNSARDANPFFHLYEALWMLAGRKDVAPLAYYCSNMASFSDDGETLNGAYGYRWRHTGTTAEPSDTGDGPEADQLNLLVSHLKADPTSRRAVLQMWNVEDDLLKIGYPDPGDWIPASKDVCCNLSVMFSQRWQPGVPNKVGGRGQYFLDMTVTNRSNDLVWGLLGANYVHFSILQEYMAARLGVEVGKYHHFTNNLHAYVGRKDWNPEGWLKSSDEGLVQGEWYGHGAKVESKNDVPLVRDPEVFERELPLFVETYSGDNPERKTWAEYTEPFIRDVAVPMMTAFSFHKRKQYESAVKECDSIAADDWKIAARNWLERRKK